VPVFVLFVLGLACCSNAEAIGGSAMGWGYNGFGQVGNGTEGGGLCECVATPVPLTGITTATQLAGGDLHSLALLADGSVAAWGYGLEGQLGTGGETSSSSPRPVPGVTGAISIAAGWSHSLALLADGTVMAWGVNDRGALGLGTSSGPDLCFGGKPCAKSPTKVPGLSGVIAIAAQGQSSYALLADGSVMAWGAGQAGQLGDAVKHEAGCQCADAPQTVPGVAGAVQLAAGGDGGSALLADGSIRNWGNDLFGQAGNGQVTIAPAGCACVAATVPSGLSGARLVTAGGYSRLAALSDGRVMAWGRNNFGQLGSPLGGPELCESEPCSRAPATVKGVSAVQSLAAGEYMSFALLANGTAAAWGYDFLGNLGDGAATGSKPAPVTVSAVSGASDIAAGKATGFAIVGPSEALNVSMAGAGVGSVGGAGLLCVSAFCSARVPQGRVENLRAQAATGSGFAGFSGPCQGTGACQVRLEGAQTVTATFGPPKGTRITTARIDKKRGKASFHFEAPGAITGYQCELIKPKPKRGQGKKRKPRFSKCNSPKAYRHLRPGRYGFRVRALDILGADATPALRQFKLRKPTKNH
jgi:alpha-tubulin suppressor-like RCC1 family protein